MMRTSGWEQNISVNTNNLLRAWAERPAAARVSTALQQPCRWRWWRSASGPKENYNHANSSITTALALHQRGYLRPVVVVTQRRINGQVGEVLSDGLSHVSDHLDDRVCGELTWRDVRGAVPAWEARQMVPFKVTHSNVPLQDKLATGLLNLFR